MEYLKLYNFTDNQIDYLKKFLTENGTIENFEYNEKAIRDILDLFQILGIKNLYNIIVANPFLFYDTKESVKRRIDKYPNKKVLSFLINLDINNLKLIDML